MQKGRCNVVGSFATINNEPSKTQKSKKNLGDINYLIKRANKTGVMPVVSSKPIFADVSSLGDYHDMLNKGLAAKRAFEALPQDFRKRVKNDPKKAIEFIEDPNNTLEAVELGVLPKDVIPKHVDDPNDKSKCIYVDKNGNKVEPLPGQTPVVELNARKAALADKAA